MTQNNGSGVGRSSHFLMSVISFVFIVAAIAAVGLQHAEADPPASDNVLGSPTNRRLQQTGYETSKLIAKFQVAKAKFMEKMAKDYGAGNIDTIFKTKENENSPTLVSVGRTQFNFLNKSGSDEFALQSWNRMKRKIMMKILQAQVQQKHQKFVYSTAGHSAAAGHGNLFNETYTAFFGYGASDIFSAVGLNLTARNYAMGSTSAGMELASCIKEVYGMDVDLFSWNFGMTTVHQLTKIEYWMYRAMKLPTRPGIICISCDNTEQYDPVLTDMSKRGMPTFRLKDKPIKESVPDSMGKSQTEIDKMPPFVRLLRCGKEIEKGEPCGDEKFSDVPDEPCNKRAGRVHWHPGWKAHALTGNLLTFFCLELIDDALKEVLSDGSDPQALLNRLKKEENQEYTLGEALGVPKDLPALKGRNGNYYYRWGQIIVPYSVNETNDIPNNVFYDNPGYCHTARVPSHARYQGIATESNLKDQDSFWPTNYDKGTEFRDALNSSDTESPMKLVYDGGVREPHCKNQKLRIDFQDFFFANSNGWGKLTIPNQRAKRAYKLNQPFHGIVAVCFSGCGWGCPKGTLGAGDIKAGKLSMTVNGQNVVNFTNMVSPTIGDKEKHLCAFLKHAGGHKFTPSKTNDFEIRARPQGRWISNPRGNLTSPNYVRFASLMVW